MDAVISFQAELQTKLKPPTEEIETIPPIDAIIVILWQVLVNPLFISHSVFLNCYERYVYT